MHCHTPIKPTLLASPLFLPIKPTGISVNTVCDINKYITQLYLFFQSLLLTGLH